METTSIFNTVYTSKYFKNLPDFKEKKTQAFITIALTLITLCFFGIFAISPTISTIANLQKQQEDNTFVEQKLDQKFANLIRLTKEYQMIEPDLPYVYAAVPKTPEVPQFIGQLASLGTQNNSTITRIQTYEVDLTKKNSRSEKFSTVGFTIEATGTYTNLFKYVDALTNFSRIITIDTIAISKGTEGTTDLKLSVKGQAYFKQ